MPAGLAFNSLSVLQPPHGPSASISAVTAEKLKQARGGCAVVVGRRPASLYGFGCPQLPEGHAVARSSSSYSGSWVASSGLGKSCGAPCSRSTRSQLRRNTYAAGGGFLANFASMQLASALQVAARGALAVVVAIFAGIVSRTRENFSSLSQGERRRQHRGERNADASEKALRDGNFLSCPLPALTAADQQLLAAGDIVRRQERKQENGHSTGRGLFVADVDAPPSVVLGCLQDFENYSRMIPVVRHVEVTSRVTEDPAKGCFQAWCDYKVSKFFLPFCVNHSVKLQEGSVDFKLHPSNVGLLLRKAVGKWIVRPAPGGDPNRTRVYFTVRLRASWLCPHWLVEYAAGRAMKRATSWLRPYVEEAWKRQKLGEALRQTPQEDDASVAQHHGDASSRRQAEVAAGSSPSFSAQVFA
eukprot:TRINITY_DN31890_c0_g1_i2.p1 TRINITY_DN31890_c0_g1~~TRINITY_DN31890_c0_g1_i2.p1  ORF type:complete len:415 (+),score=54.77 TRINITY_DN31890_c0_g1_i2:117-1361(+)